MIKAVTFHAAAVRVGAAFRPVVRVAKATETETGTRVRMIGRKSSPFTFATEADAVAFAADRAEHVARAERAAFPATSYTVKRKAAPTKAEAVRAVAERGTFADVLADMDSMLAELAARNAARIGAAV